NFLQSARLLGDACVSFNNNCAIGIEPNYPVIERHVENSLMLVTALNTHIGYEKSAEIAKKAHKEGTSLRQAAMKLGGRVDATDLHVTASPQLAVAHYREKGENVIDGRPQPVPISFKGEIKREDNDYGVSGGRLPARGFRCPRLRRIRGSRR
ncbi:MAG: hypothetical protein WCP21_05460, partial [Armatimonadota bacterium]